MKIEKISDNQIKCTLDMDDLKQRGINLSELAYGSDKARVLFSEMLDKAHREVQFDYSNIPLMVEAVPMSGGQLILIVTRVENPEELDTRFSTFAPSVTGASSKGNSSANITAEDILKAMHRLFPGDTERTGQAPEEPAADTEGSSEDIIRTFLFRGIGDLLAGVAVISRTYRGLNSLYRRPGTEEYYLTAHKSDHTPEEFNRICNILTEFSSQIKPACSTESYYREHYETVIADCAVRKFSEET